MPNYPEARRMTILANGSGLPILGEVSRLRVPLVASPPRTIARARDTNSSGSSSCQFGAVGWSRQRQCSQDAYVSSFGRDVREGLTAAFRAAHFANGHASFFCQGIDVPAVVARV